VGVLEIFVAVLAILEGCPGNIQWVSWKYLMDILNIFDGCSGDT